MRINEELVEFWHAIFIAAQKLQEQGKPADYANITQRMLRLSPGIISRIPYLCGVDIDYTMIESWLEEETAPPEERAKRRTHYESLSNMRECTLPYEQWLPIINHEDYYISNLGRVWSLKRRDGLMTPQLKNRPDRRNKKKLRLYEYVPAMCRLDYAMSEAGGASDFVREYTLSSGGPYCDCGYKKKV